MPKSRISSTLTFDIDFASLPTSLPAPAPPPGEADDDDDLDTDDEAHEPMPAPDGVDASELFSDEVKNVLSSRCVARGHRLRRRAATTAPRPGRGDPGERGHY